MLLKSHFLFPNVILCKKVAQTPVSGYHCSEDYMLIEFSVENFRSFRARATLSLEASNDDWLEDECVTTVGGLRLLKSAAIFGANAGGKSNFLKAMAVFRNFIRNSSKETQQGEKIPV